MSGHVGSTYFQGFDAKGEGKWFQDEIPEGYSKTNPLESAPDKKDTTKKPQVEKAKPESQK